MTVEEALRNWRLSLGRNSSSYDSPTLDIDTGFAIVKVPNPGFTHLHDLHHVVLQTGFTLAGESVVSAYELMTGSPTRLVFILNLVGVIFGLAVAPGPVIRTLWQARNWSNLYGISDEKYSEILKWDWMKLRKHLGIMPNQGCGC